MVSIIAFHEICYMNKIKLSDNAKRILLALGKDTDFNYDYKDSDEKDLVLLEIEGLVDPCWTYNGPSPYITERGIAYVHMNPELKDPTIWDDKKYWVTTGISVIALIVSIAALIFSIGK